MHTDTTSVDAIKLSVNVNATSTPAANEALFMVIWPHRLFSVTPVDLLVDCVTTPPAPVAYPMPAAALPSSGRLRSYMVIVVPESKVEKPNSYVPVAVKVIILEAYPCNPVVPRLTAAGRVKVYAVLVMEICNLIMPAEPDAGQFVKLKLIDPVVLIV